MLTHSPKQSEQQAPVTAQRQTGIGAEALQRVPALEEKDLLQGKFEAAFGDRQSRSEVLPIQRRANNTGLPDQLKSSIENLSGHAMDDVKVHYNSDQPAQLNAHAYAQGTDIHLGPGQEKHLPHEAWHVVQQKQGRVRPTMQMKGKVNINNDAGLEREADVMGGRAMTASANSRALPDGNIQDNNKVGTVSAKPMTLQGMFVESDDFKGFLGEQMKAQYNNGYGAPYITVGFEHEFAEMKDGPLIDTTHVELVESQKIRMPLTDLGFSLETDAANAIELVSPPFILEPISKSVPVPKPEDVAKVDHIIQEHLAALVTKDQSFGELLKAFGEDPGIDFQQGNVEVASANVNPGIKTDFKALETKTHEAEVKQNDILNITVGKGRKSSLHGAISSQVNFATDAPTYHQTLQAEEPTKDKDTRPLLILEEDILKRLVAFLPEDKDVKPSTNLKIFLREMARRMASTLAARSIERAEALKRDIFDKKKINKKDSYDLHVALRSHVKDTKGLWLKDTLENFGLGILQPDDWRLMQRLALSKDLHNALESLKLGGTSKKDTGELKLNLKQAVGEMVTGLKGLARRIVLGGWQKDDPSVTLSGMDPQPAFGSHDPSHLGVRQDTFLTLKDQHKKELPQRWMAGDKGRLHVVETRGDSLSTLFHSIIAAGIKGGFKDEEISLDLEKRTISIQKDAEKRFLRSKKDINKKETPPHNVKVMQDLVSTAKDLMKYANPEYIAEVRKRLEG